MEVSKYEEVGNGILISGINGFVGKKLRISFSDEFEVKGLSRSISADPDIYQWNELFSIRKPQRAWIHLSGSKADEASVDLEKELELVSDAFRHFKETHSEIFIYFSSVKAVSSKVNGVLLETHLYEKENPYGAVKRAVEKFLLAQELNANQRLYILRPCVIHGPGNAGSLRMLFRFIKKGFPYPLGAFDNQRSFLSVVNMQYLVYQMVMQKPKSGVYNLSDDEFLSTGDLIKIMSKVLGKKVKVLKISPTLILKLAQMGDKFGLPFNSIRLQKLVSDYKVSNEKIKSTLSINTLPTSIEQGIEVSIRSFLK